LSTLSLDPSVSLFEPAAATATARTAQPARRPEPAPRVERHGRRAERSTAMRARRASAASTASLAVLARAAQQVAVRVLGTSAAAAAVTWALALKSRGEPGALATLSIRGLAAAAIICAAWGFQDRPRLGALGTTRAWYGTALVLALAHSVWFASTLPGTVDHRLGAIAAAFTLDVILVAAPALLGARAGRPETRPEVPADTSRETSREMSAAV
jgi:hypothetical protein